MKILFFSRRFWPSIGGVEKHVMEVGKRLVKMGYEVTVVSESSTSEESRSLPRHHPRCLKVYYISVRANEKSKKFQIWEWLWKNRCLIQEADIVHCHDVFYWYLPFRFLYPKKKVFTTFHGWEGIYPPRWQAKVIRNISEKLSFGNICVGDFIRKWYGTRADYTTYGGVTNPPRRSHVFPADSAGQPDTVRGDSKRIYDFCFIGRLEKDTGLLIYLQALEKFIIYNLKFKIRFLGDGSLRKEAERLGEVLGFMEGLEEYVKNFDFIFTSGYLSILEAMINKKLVFATFDNPLKEDYLKMAPFSQWIVIESDPKELAKKVLFYAKNPGEEKKLVKNAYNWAREQSWEKVTEGYLAVWEKPR